MVNVLKILVRRAIKGTLTKHFYFRNFHTRGKSEISKESADRIHQVRSHYSKWFLFVSHSNHLTNLGGTERLLLEQVEALAGQGIGSICLSAEKAKSPLLPSNIACFTVIFQNEILGKFTFDQLRPILELFRFERLVAHHFLYWPLSLLQQLLKNTKITGSSAEIFLHDFFTFCPSINLPCANLALSADCGKVSASSSLSQPLSEQRCLNSFSPQFIQFWREELTNFLSDFRVLYFQSEFVRRKIARIWPELEPRLTLHQHFRFDPVGQIKFKGMPRKTRIAFLGMPTPSKGWDAWMRLLDNDQFVKNYEFFHFAAVSRVAEHVTNISYDYRTDGQMGLTNRLRQTGIDIAMIWSEVPETYSFTFHEAMAAGIPILTGPRSGCINEIIARRGQEIGLAFPDESALWAFLGDRKQVENLLKVPRTHFTLTTDLPSEWQT